MTDTTEEACTCQHLVCVCYINRTHDSECKYRRAATGAIGIECPHGFDVCRRCDPCTCAEGQS